MVERRSIEVVREVASVHESGGLGASLWSKLRPMLDAPKQRPLLAGNVQEYARGVLEGSVSDKQFNGRKYLDKHDWQEVEQVLSKATLKRSLVDVVKKRVRFPQEVDMKYYAAFEQARAYSLRDYVLDKTHNSLDWQNKQWVDIRPIAQTADPFLDYTFDPARLAKGRELDDRGMQYLRDVFLTDAVDITTIPPQELYENLLRRVAKDTSLAAKLSLNRPDDWKKIYLTVSSEHPAVGQQLGKDYAAHFGIQPVVRADILTMNLEIPSNGVLPTLDNPFVMSKVPRIE